MVGFQPIITCEEFFSQAEQRACVAIGNLSLQICHCTANSLAVASVASLLASFLDFSVDIPFCLPISHAVIDLVSAARI